MIIIIHFTLWLLCFAKSNANERKSSFSRDLLRLRVFCPHNKFCQFDPLKIIQDKNFEPCCEACSCENNCFETGSCCPDMPLSGLVEPKYPCRNLWHFGKGVEDLNEYTGDWYHVIDDCPNEVKASLYQRCYKPKEFQDYIIVTDTNTGRVYRNKHCAECNSIWNYTKLPLRVDCKNQFAITNIKTAKEIEDKILNLTEHCSLRSNPPAKRIGMSHCLPESRVISVCNATGRWKVYNQEFEKGCIANSFDQNKVFKQFVDGRFNHYIYFANVYCFLCNADPGEQKIDTCEIFDGMRDVKSGLIPFHVILDTNVWGAETLMTEETTCFSSHIWDPVERICRQLFCPFGHIPHYGSCKSLFSNIEGYSLSMDFEVIIEDGIFSGDVIVLHFFKQRVTRELGADLSCGVCRSNLFSKKNSTVIFFRHGVFAKEGCLYHSLSKRIRQLAIKRKIYLFFKHRSQLIRVVLRMVFENINYHTDGFSNIVETVDAFCSNVIKVDEQIFLYCPSIMLSSVEVNELGLTNLNVNPQIKDMNDSSQKVCVDVYFSQKQLNSGMIVEYCLTLYNIVGIALIIIWHSVY